MANTISKAVQEGDARPRRLAVYGWTRNAASATIMESQSRQENPRQVHHLMRQPTLGWLAQLARLVKRNDAAVSAVSSGFFSAAVSSFAQPACRSTATKNGVHAL